MLSYCRETALQGALALTKSGENILRTLNHCDIIGYKAIEFSENTQHKGYYAVQGHLRSSRSVAIESPYATLLNSN